jgi:transcriptional regulator with XRE-family HTH domain
MKEANEADLTLRGAGEALRTIRQQKGVSLRQLAEDLKMSQGTLSKYENNQVGMDMEVLLKLSGALQVEPSEMLRACLKVLMPSLIGNPIGAAICKVLENPTPSED